MRNLLLILGVMMSVAWHAQAQDYRYDVYLDSDSSTATGCTVTLPSGTITGVESRIRAEIAGTTVSNSSLSLCSAGSFPAGTALPAPYSVGLNNGTAGSDVIEISTPATLAPAGSTVPVHVAATNGAGTTSDLLSTTNGLIDGPPIVLGFPVVNVPSLGMLGLGLMIVVLAFFGMKKVRRATRAGLAALGLLMVAGAVWAAAFVVDGQVGDWAGVNALATDPAGDGSAADSGIDLRAFYAAFENGRLFVRVDVTDVENQPPVANPVALTVLEDAVPQTLTLSGTDADGDPMTFAVQTNPTLGTLGALTPINTTSASVPYTLTPNANGADSFTYVANDGFVNSAPATVAITITPVNDAPLFTAQNPPTVNEDAGPQTATVATGIAAGPANESGQALTFTITGNTNPVLFNGAVTVDSAGLLSYTPAANANGTATLTLQLQDNGGTANGGIDTAATQNITVTVTAINDAPGFIAGANPTVLEDAAAQTVPGWATGISAGPADEAGQTLTFNVTGNTNPTLFSAAPAISATGDLTYTPAANANGTATLTITLSDNGGTANGGIDTSAPATFTITVTAVNDAPSFTSGGNVVVLKDTGANTVNPWATAISAGPANEAGQTLSFNITNNTNSGLFSVQPAVSPTGVLTFTTLANANGVATITLSLMDNGGTANGGVDTSPTQSFDITLTAVNDAPSFTAGANQTVLEDAAAQTVNAWATAISAGPPDEIGQTLTFNVAANTNPTLFSVAPAISPTGTLTYTPAANANGIASLTITLQDNGGTANGGVDTSAPVTFTISVTAVNDAPTFTPGANPTVNEDAGPQTVNPWATLISAGPADETGQTLTFNVTGNTNPTLFSAGPAISPAGVLTYTPAANTSGTATITLNLQDNGGTANGGANTSAPPVNFTITVNSVNDAPSFTAGLNQTVLEDSGPQTVNPWATAISPGPADEAGQTLTFNVTGNTNPGLFSAAPAISPTGTLTYTPAANAFGVATITVTLQDNGGTANGGVDTSAPQNVTITITDINDVPSFTAGPNQAVPQNAGAQTVNPWATAIAAGPANEAGQTLTFNITGNTNPGLFSAGPAVSPTGVLTYTPAIGMAGIATITLNLQDNGGTANGGVDTTATQNFTISVDSAPTVTVTTPTNGSTVANNVALGITFSESVTATVGSVTLTCGGPNLITGGTAGVGVTSLTPTYTAPLPAANCTLTILAANITDADTIDPPDNMAANVVVTFTVDAAPRVNTVTPVNGATNVAGNAPITITFSEPVAAGVTAFAVECPTGAPAAFTASASPATVYTLTPNTSWPGGVTCTVTVLAPAITDSDAFDPPNTMVANFVSSFSTDAAPTVTGGTPLNLATNVSTTTTVTYTFSENVDAGPGAAITLDCGGPIAGVVSGSGTGTLTFTPSAALPTGIACTATAVAANIGDSDANDPPNNLAADSVRTFTTDAPPAVTTTVPANGATGVAGSSPITINFNEAVNFDTTASAANVSFDLECPVATPANFAVGTASPATSVVLDPLDTAVAGQTCTLTVRAAGITDQDPGDPPNNPIADFVATIQFAAVAEDDAYPVNRHLTLSAPAAVETDANDILGGGTITGFGATLGTANGLAPGATLDDGANGTLLLNANGTFTFFPPVNPASATTDFFYTVTGGDTASITFTYQDELVWFVDDNAAGTTCTGDNAGAQACPATTLTAIAGIDTTNDYIFLASGAYTATITLEVGERLIGDGASGTLTALTGITPVPGSTFPNFTGTAPIISCGGNCLTMPAAGNNVLRGFTVADSGTTGTDISGNGFGTLTVNEVTLNGNGRALNLATGTLTGNFLDLDVTGTTGTTEGLLLNTVGGTWTVAGALNFASIAGGNGIDIRNAPATANITFGAGTNVAKTSAGNAVFLGTNNAASTINLGTVVLSNSNGAAFNSNASPVTITGAGSTLTATGGPALDATTTTFNGGATFATVSSSGSAGKGINLDAVIGAVVMNGGAVTSPSGIAFDLNAGNSNVTYAGTLTSTAATRLIEITTRTGGTTTLSGNLSGTGGTHTGINIAGNTGGTITLSGATKTINTGANTAVTVVTNTGATIGFTGGGLDIDTTSGAGFSAAGGGTVSVIGAANTLTSTTGIALNVVNTTVGAGGLNWQRIDSTGAASNAAVVLTNTGAGPVSVTGTGAAGSGGTIDNKTADAIILNNTSGLITLNQMIIEDIGDMTGPSGTLSGHDAIQGLNVNAGLSLTGTTIRRVSDAAIHGGNHLVVTDSTVWNGLILNNVTIEDSNRFHVAARGDANNEGTVRIVGLRGTVSVTDSTFTRGAEFLDVFVVAGTMNLTVTNNDFLSSYKEFTAADASSVSSVGNHCIDVVVQGTGNANVVIGDTSNALLGNTFQNCRIGSIRVVDDPGVTGTHNTTISNNQFLVNDHVSGVFCNPACQNGDFDFPQGGVLVGSFGANDAMQHNVLVTNNVFDEITNASGGPGQLSLSLDNGDWQAWVEGNTFDTPGNAPWFLRANSTNSARVLFRNNTYVRGFLASTDAAANDGQSTVAPGSPGTPVFGYFGPGLRTLAIAQATANLDIRIDQEDFSKHDLSFDPGSTFEAQVTSGNLCTHFTNNTSPHGFALEQSGGTLRLQSAAAGSCAAGTPGPCQTVLQGNGNRGGDNSTCSPRTLCGNSTVNPPDVDVLGTVNFTTTACAQPSGGIFP